MKNKMNKTMSRSKLGLQLAFLLLVTTFAFSQEPRDDAKPSEPAKAEQPDRDAKPPRQDEAKPSDARPSDAKPSKDEAKPRQNEREDTRPEAAQPHNNEAKPVPDSKRQDQDRDRQVQNDKGQASGKSARIPDDKFRANFGRQHTLRVQTTVVGGQPRFQYSGYWFVLSDPWPAEWAYTDECYIDYIDGEYFLFDLLHPGVRIALIVNM